jgi:hypothetical protein
MLRPRKDRSTASDCDELLSQLKEIFLRHYEHASEARWSTIATLTEQQANRTGHADLLAQHLLGGARNPRPLDTSSTMMKFGYHFSVALGFAIEAAWTCRQGRLERAASLLNEGWYFAGVCGVEAEFKDPSATTAENLRIARGSRKDREMKAAVMRWCDENKHRYPGANNRELADAVSLAHLVPMTWNTIYRWVCHWSRTCRTSDR